MQFLIILSGAISSSPENQVYFLQASTNGVTGSSIPNPARWTYFAVCGTDSNGNNANCGSTTAALPFNAPQNFGTSDGLPADLVNNTNRYYYLSRFAWVFYIIALFFAVCAFLVSLLALCSRLGAYLTGATTAIAWFFQTLAAALMTYVSHCQSLRLPCHPADSTTAPGPFKAAMPSKPTAKTPRSADMPTASPGAPWPPSSSP